MNQETSNKYWQDSIFQRHATYNFHRCPFTFHKKIHDLQHFCCRFFFNIIKSIPHGELLNSLMPTLFPIYQIWLSLFIHKNTFNYCFLMNFSMVLLEVQFVDTKIRPATNLKINTISIFFSHNLSTCQSDISITMEKKIFVFMLACVDVDYMLCYLSIDHRWPWLIIIFDWYNIS